MTYDLNFMADTTEKAKVPLTFDNTVNQDAFKLAQRVLVLLFKDKDSALLPSLGTDALNLLSGNTRSQQDLENQFNIASDRVRAFIVATQSSDAPETEQLDTLKVVPTVDELNRDHIFLDISVTTVSGEAYTSSVPIKLRGE